MKNTARKSSPSAAAEGSNWRHGIPAFAGMTILLCFTAFAAAKDNISRISIHFADVSTHKISEDDVRSVLPIKEGDVLTPQELDNAIDQLKKWGIFETIQASTTPSSNGVDIDFYVAEALLIGKIDIKGNYPYIEQKISKYLTIRPGDIYTRPRIEEQIQRIKDFYEREGFFNTVVTSKEVWYEANRDVGIVFEIKKGSILRYGNINIEGAHTYPKGRIISYINPLRPYQPRRFSSSIRGISEFYHRHGFPRARVKSSYKLDIDRGKIDVDILVTEGPKVEVKFIGNKSLGHRRLMKSVPIFKEGGFDEYEIEESKDALVKLYHREGFPDASVDAARKIWPDGAIIVSFYVNEGEKQRVTRVDIEGNNGLNSHRIKKQMQIKTLSILHKGIYDKTILANDLDSIKKYYGSEGYLNARIDEPKIEEKSGQVQISIPILENGRAIVKDIELVGNQSFNEGAILKIFKNKEGKPVNNSALSDDKDALINYYADHGYPYADVEQTLDASDNAAIIHYDIKEGSQVKIGRVLAVGNSLTTTGAIKKAMLIHEGEPFSQQKIIESQVALRRLGTFNTVNVDIIGLEKKEKVVHLRVKVEEQKPFAMDFGFGYSTDDRYSGSVAFTNLNSFGLAKRTNLKLTGGRELSRAEANWIDPRFVGSDFEMTTSTWLQYEDKNVFNYMQAGGGFGFFRRYHRTGILAKYELERNYFVEGDSVAADANSLRDNSISKVTLSASFDTRNSFSEPTRGIFAMINSEFYNEIRGANANFVKLRWFFGQYTGFWKRFSLINNARLDRIQEIGGNASIPSNELFLLGGDDTLRGFSEDSLGPLNASGQPTGGRVRWIYNAELRIKLLKSWQWAFFYDTGALVNEFRQIDMEAVRQSTGVGLRYITPVGPIRFDYGIILDKISGDHFGRFHFTFGYVF